MSVGVVLENVSLTALADLFGTLALRTKAGQVQSIHLTMQATSVDEADGHPSGYQVEFDYQQAAHVGAWDVPLMARPDPVLYRVTATFKARYPRACTIDPSHRISRGDEVGRLARTDNPMLEGYWVACAACTKELK